MSMGGHATSVGASDIFVLRALDDGRLFNLDGHGRGAGWAGNISVATDEEPLVHRGVADGFVTRRSGVPFRVFGPYWTTSVAVVAVPGGVVVFGGGSELETQEHILRPIADELSQSVSGVPTAKREADEAELKQAAALLKNIDAATIQDAANEIAAIVARALSCEFGAVLLEGDPVRLFLADEGWRPAASDDEIIAALLPLRDAAKHGMVVEQDLAQSAFPYRPLSREDGLVARCVVPIGVDGSLGILVIAHSGSAARGFTQLCQRVASTMGDAAGKVLGSHVTVN